MCTPKKKCLMGAAQIPPSTDKIEALQKLLQARSDTAHRVATRRSYRDPQKFYDCWWGTFNSFLETDANIHHCILEAVKEKIENGGLNLDKDGFSTNSNITIDKINSLIKGRPDMGTVKAVILHRTVSSNYPGSWMKAKTKSKGAHFYIDKDGTTYQTASTKKSVAHLYNSSKQMYPQYYKVLVNTNTIGIEVIGSYVKGEWEELTPRQIEAVILLVDQLKDEYHLTDENIYPHEKVQKKTKGEGQTVLDAINRH